MLLYIIIVCILLSYIISVIVYDYCCMYIISSVICSLCHLLSIMYVYYVYYVLYMSSVICYMLSCMYIMYYMSSVICYCILLVLCHLFLSEDLQEVDERGLTEDLRK